MSVITFLIGNGFDRACGLKSRYKDSYDGYVKSDSSTEVVDRFKKTIEKDIDTWADFEMKLAEYACSLKTESELFECILDYTTYLNTYLRREQQSFFELKNNNIRVRAAMINEMGKSLVSFFSDLTPNDKHAISLSLSGSPTRTIQCINFNYTTIFDELEKEAFNTPPYSSDRFQIAPVIHIHGLLDSNVVLGVDNQSQLSGLPYTISHRKLRHIIKPAFIEAYDQERGKNALSYIHSSNVICVFGLSFGESDLTWKKAVAAWLINSKSNHLVFFNHKLSTANYANAAANQKMDDEEDAKEALMETIFGETREEEKYQQVFKQIHIPTGSNIFNISKVSEIALIEESEQEEKNRARSTGSKR